jgi:hypothetical protein
LLLAGCAHRETSEPRTFAGVPLLETKEVIGRTYPLTGCETKNPGPVSTVSCRAEVPFAGAVRQATMEFVGEGSDHFLSMTMPIGRADCESVEAELIRLYGKPAGGAGHDAWKWKRIVIHFDVPQADGPGQLRVAFNGAMLILRQLPQ